MNNAKPNIREILANAGARKLKLSSSWLMKKRQLNRKLPLCVEAISVTCGGKLIDQLRPFVAQVKFLHPELPLHIATDPEGVEKIQDLLGPDDVVWKLVQKDHELYGKTNSKDHGSRWSQGWIGIKLENFRRAIVHFRKGVLQCDSDFIFNRSLPKANWQADVVMSTHRGPLMHNNVPDFHGNYNAGLLLSDDTKVAEKWIELYRQGYGGFYEQKLLEKFDDLFVVDLFPSDWNWGAWRNQEDVKHSRRIPTFFHTHITGPHTQDTPLHEVAMRRMFIMNRSYGTYPKYAFYHLSKAAGSELMRILHDVVQEQVQYQVLNSYTFRIGDWDEEELKLIVAGAHKYQQGNRFIVHNHCHGWSQKSMELFDYYGWRFFGLYRPVRDRMASFYNWSIGKLKKTGGHPMHGPITSARTINDFFELMLTDEYKPEWVLPERADLIDWYEASNEGISRLLKDKFNLTLSQSDFRRENSSQGERWSSYEPRIDKSVLRELQKEFDKWDDFESSVEIKK